jgi:hypothetical protein
MRDRSACSATIRGPGPLGVDSGPSPGPARAIRQCRKCHRRINALDYRSSIHPAVALDRPIDRALQFGPCIGQRGGLNMSAVGDAAKQ